MLRLAVIALLAASCSKADTTGKKPAAAAADVTRDGVRRVAIEANNDGYTPEKIPGKPGEKLVLVFTRTADSSCIEELRTPDGKTVKLPMNTPVEVPVTVPAQGRVDFACGMDMFHGVVVADPR